MQQDKRVRHERTGQYDVNRWSLLPYLWQFDDLRHQLELSSDGPSHRLQEGRCFRIDHLETYCRWTICSHCQWLSVIDKRILSVVYWIRRSKHFHIPLSAIIWFKQRSENNTERANMDKGRKNAKRKIAEDKQTSELAVKATVFYRDSSRAVWPHIRQELVGKRPTKAKGQESEHPYFGNTCSASANLH